MRYIILNSNIIIILWKTVIRYGRQLSVASCDWALSLDLENTAEIFLAT